MMKIDVPSFSVKEVYSACISTVQDKTLKQQLSMGIKEVVQDEAIYTLYAATDRLSCFPQKQFINGNIDIANAKKLYTYRLLQTEAGRKYYNKIRNSVDCCPLCGVREVSTLDHHMPKSLYATATVMPQNLVPSCKDCNTKKDVCNPQNPNEETWHPYFEDYSDIKWLYAQIVRSDPVSIDYYVNVPDFNDSFFPISDVSKRKIENSFRIFELKKLYRIKAINDINTNMLSFVRLKNKLGRQELQEHLNSLYLGASKLDRNSWKAALYEALEQDDWFIDSYVH